MTSKLVWLKTGVAEVYSVFKWGFTKIIVQNYWNLKCWDLAFHPSPEPIVSIHHYPDQETRFTWQQHHLLLQFRFQSHEYIYDSWWFWLRGTSARSDGTIHYLPWNSYWDSFTLLFSWFRNYWYDLLEWTSVLSITPKLLQYLCPIHKLVHGQISFCSQAQHMGQKEREEAAGHRSHHDKDTTLCFGHRHAFSCPFFDRSFCSKRLNFLWAATWKLTHC